MAEVRTLLGSGSHELCTSDLLNFGDLMKGDEGFEKT